MKKRCEARVNRAGFTLIELLVVIAIITILAGLTAVAIPRYFDKAREVRTIANLDSVAKGLIQYSARSDNTAGFPTGYGMILPEARDVPVTDLLLDPPANFQLKPYTLLIGIREEEDVYQELGWAPSYDSNRDGGLSLAEYLPIGVKDVATGNVVFSDDIYQITNPTPLSNGTFNEVQNQLDQGKRRPFAYIPYNKRQLDAATRYWYAVEPPTAPGANVMAGTFDTTHSALQGRMFFPPPSYDGFVLIGNGAQGNDGGILSVDPPGTPGTDYDEEYTYHVLALRIAFLATRDQDDDRLKDFSYLDRKQATAPFPLPDGTNGQGPFIYVH